MRITSQGPAIGVVPPEVLAARLQRVEPQAPQDSKAYLRERRKQIIADMAARLLAGEDPDEQLLPFLYRTLAAERIVDASIGFVVTDQEDGMKLGFAKGFPDAVVKRCVRLDFGQAVCGTVAKTRKAMHVTDIQRSLDPLADLIRAAGINAYACEPLIVGGRLLGTLSFASRSRRAFDTEDLHFFQTIAKHVAIARDRARKRHVSTTAA